MLFVNNGFFNEGKKSNSLYFPILSIIIFFENICGVISKKYQIFLWVNKWVMNYLSISNGFVNLISLIKF